MAPETTAGKSDSERVRNPQVRAARAQIAAYLPLIRPKMEALAGALPTYVANPLAELLAAFDRWELDEHDAMTKP